MPRCADWYTTDLHVYFATGLQAAGSGHLELLEINREWADIAERDICAVSNRFTLTRGSLEDVLTAPIDIAFVDTIHQYGFVVRQFDVLKHINRCSRNQLCSQCCSTITHPVFGSAECTDPKKTELSTVK